MHLITIGRLRAGPEAELFHRYNTRLQPKLAVIELPEARGGPAEVRRREASALVAAVPRQGFAVALDQGGIALNSQELATHLERWLARGQLICFLIGGTEGLDAPVLARADFVLSLGAMTWPHLLVRAMLAEQLYRARSIAAGHPYHRSSRPGA
ncbi:23S rRNA (pseudouridine(1915)-N(3))-methyltransferase RlmH [Rhodopila sp.]|uniref:23S rRNA (pseudouridine(1915)-N(3))-methyltransferase RlmH n=1 Tax=Rhodopila sp. TaxID=2480087 RepID=UPI003D0FAC18